MDGSFTSRRGTSSFVSRCTTLLACLWGATAAYILCHSLIVTHTPRYTMAALVSLITVWATLERKRWGRMALIGVSVTTIGVFGFFISAFSAFSGSAQSKEVRSLQNAMMELAKQYQISSSVIYGLVLLAIVSSLWLCRAEVVAEFNQHKHAVLVTGQRVIATTLAVCWGAAIALNPMLPFQQGNRPSSPHPFARPRLKAGGPHTSPGHPKNSGGSHASASHRNYSFTLLHGQSRKSAPRRSLLSHNRR